MGNNQTITRNMASKISIGNSKEWVEIKTENGVIAFWTRPLSSGSFPPCQFSLLLKIEYEHSVFKPILIFYYRSEKASFLPTSATLRIVEGDSIVEESTCNSEPVYSIVGKDYVSKFLFLIREDNLIKLFNGTAKCTVSYFNDKCPIPVVKDDTLTYAKLKKHLDPKSLSGELKEVLLVENERIEEEKRRIKEQKEKERLEEIEKKRVEEENRRNKAQKENDYHIQNEFVQIRILNYLLSNSIYLELNDCFIVSDPLSYPSLLKDLNQYVIEGLSHFNEQFQFKLNDINTASALSHFPSNIVSESRTDSDRRYCRFFGDSFYHYRIINDDSTRSNTPSINNVKSAISTHYWRSKDLVAKMDFKPDYYESAAKGLARYFIENAVLVKKVLYGTEYMVFDYFSGYDTKNISINDKAKLELERYGIVSNSKSECFDRDSRYYGGHGYVLFVHDYKAICGILDGPPPQVQQKKESSDGCFVATCVYGSYDCPEVWTLRRYRDQVLRNSWLGRAFVRVYYYLSPKIVRKFGDKAPFISINRRVLDGWVRSLNKKGFENTSYHDQ